MSVGRVDTPGAWSIRTRKMPRELSPSICAAVMGVTLDPTGFDVLPAI